MKSSSWNGRIRPRILGASLAATLALGAGAALPPLTPVAGAVTATESGKPGVTVTVYRVSGEVRWKPNLREPLRPLTPFMRLKPGDIIDVGAPADLKLHFGDSKRVETWTGPVIVEITPSQGRAIGIYSGKSRPTVTQTGTGGLGAGDSVAAAAPRKLSAFGGAVMRGVKSNSQANVRDASGEIDRLNRLMESGKFAEASVELDRIAKDYGGNPGFEALRAEVRSKLEKPRVVGLTAAVASRDKVKLALMPVVSTAAKLKDDQLPPATSYLRSQVVACPMMTVVDSEAQNDALRKLVREKRREINESCLDEACQIPLGAELSADTLLRASVTQMARTCTLSMELVDLATAAPSLGHSDDFDCTADGLQKALKDSSRAVCEGLGVANPAAPPTDGVDPLELGAPVAVSIAQATTARRAPAFDASACSEVGAGSEVPVSVAAVGWYGFQALAGSNQFCWVPEAALPRPGGTLPVRLKPLNAAVALTDLPLFTGATGPAKLATGTRKGDVLAVAERHADRVAVRVPAGTTGWLAANTVFPVSGVEAVPVADQGIWQAAVAAPAPVSPPSTQGSLTLDAWVQTADGGLIADGDTMTLGTEYEVHARCSVDCYLRITLETPEAGAVCQFSPNANAGLPTSPLVRAGEDAWTAISAVGLRFQVTEPIRSHDVLRVEAAPASGGPFVYVPANDAGEGCSYSGFDAAPNSKAERGFRGGGFIAAPGGKRNPTPVNVFQMTIRTVK
jgi:hypothetical protein